MSKVNFSRIDFQRTVADSASLILKNRYYEETASMTDDGTTLVARPGLKRLTVVGDGPIRGMDSEAGSFSGDMFLASGQEFYRLDNRLNQTFIYGGLNDPERGVVNMAITATIGTTPEYCFVADGANLFVYIANGFARNSLSGSPANTDLLNIGGTYYRWTTGSVDAGSPAGTAANPWLVALGGTPALSFQNMFYAINASGAPGTNYSTALTVANTQVQADVYSATFLSVRAFVVGAAGNTIVTTETGAGIAWGNPGTLSQGGAPTFSKVLLPDDIGAIDVAVSNSYVIVVPVQSGEYIGRFYWINPGEITVDPLNFATAERSPDAIYGVCVFGDQFWLPGENTSEVFYFTGDPDTPVARQQGLVLDRGSWQDTALTLHESMMLIDGDGGVFQVSGSSPSRVSDPSIEQQIREAIQLAQGYLY